MTVATQTRTGHIGLWIAVACALVVVFLVTRKNTHPRPTHPGNNRPATVAPHRPTPAHSR